MKNYYFYHHNHFFLVRKLSKQSSNLVIMMINATNSSIVPIPYSALNLMSSKCHLKTDFIFPPEIYCSQKQISVIPISEEPHNPFRSKIMDMQNNKLSNNTKHIFFYHTHRICLTRVFETQLWRVETATLLLKMFRFLIRQIRLLIAK